MIIAFTHEISCIFCKQQVTLYEYEGLEGGLYTDHFCEEEKRMIEAEVNNEMSSEGK